MSYKDRDKQRAYQRQWSRNLRLSRRQKVVDMFGGACMICGYKENILALEVDHISPVLRPKDYGLEGSRTIRLLATGKITMDGLQLICANCHSIKTAEDRKLFKNYITGN